MTRSPHSSLIVPAKKVSWWPLIFGCVIVLITIATYSNSLRVPFLFDDNSAIARNASIRNLWSLNALTAPLNATGATGRPLVNLSLAFNYAIGGNEVFGYHLFNVLLHSASALLLFGLVRRTLQSSFLREIWNQKSLPIAISTALIWSVHPLQTESVTCVIQRTELLGGFFLLLTLYCFIRAVQPAGKLTGDSRSPKTQRSVGRAPARSHVLTSRNAINPASPPSAFWKIATVFSCALGMAAKEFMVVAPVLILLYDRTFVAGTFRTAWSQRRPLYWWLGASWLILAVILSQTPQRNSNVGFGLGVSAWDYLLTQCHALVVYLKLAVWPHPLVLDYGTGLVTQWPQVWWQSLLLVALFAATGWAVWRRPFFGFLGAWFFIILAPSSSFVPLVTQTMAEHRMYLPLVPIVGAGMLALWFYAGRYARVAACVLIGGSAWLTWQRNHDYSSAILIWSDTANKAPENYRAHYNLGNALMAAGRTAEAIPSYEAALNLRANLGAMHHNLAVALGQLGRNAEAIPHYEAAIRLEPRAVDLHVNFAAALAEAGRLDEAISQYRQAAELQPSAADIHSSLAYVLLLQNRPNESIREYQIALKLDPHNPGVRDALNQLLRGRDQQ